MPEDTPGLENVEELLPLSPAQVGMLYETLSAPANGRAYVAFVRIDIEGPLSPEALRSALAEIALTPDSGRACFLHKGLDQPVQVIRRDVDLPSLLTTWLVQVRRRRASMRCRPRFARSRSRLGTRP